METPEHPAERQGKTDQVTLSNASAGLAGLLVFAADAPKTGAELCARAVELGAEPGDADGVVSGLVGDGLLRLSPT